MPSGVGLPELLVVAGIVGLVVVGLGLPIWGIIDAAGLPSSAWTQAGQNKILWVALQGVGIVFCGTGLIFALVYFLGIRPKVKAATDFFEEDLDLSCDACGATVSAEDTFCRRCGRKLGEIVLDDANGDVSPPSSPS